MIDTPVASVIIPTYNRLPGLLRVLDALAVQTCPADRFEVVVVSDGSTDGTDERLRTVDPPFHLRAARQSNAGPAAARNHGVELASGRIALFIDDDVVPEPTLVQEHLDSHAACERDAVVIGPMLTPPDFDMRPWVRWEQAMLAKQYDAMERGVYPATFRQFYTGNASLPRARVLEAGGFDTRFRRAEDVELSYRLDQAGLQFVWNPRAVGLHYADRPFESWLRTARDYGAAEVVFGREHGQDPGLDRLSAEYAGRHRFMRWLVDACIAVPWLERVLDPMARAAVIGGDRVEAERVVRLALSAVYNVAFYRAVADGLGGRSAFRRTIARRGAPAAEEPTP